MTIKILIIEDNLNDLELIRYLLKTSGYILIKAEDGVSGLKKASKRLPELILCDIKLPLLDGFQVAAQLKRDKVLCTIPLVAITAFAMLGDKEKILQAGFDGYITKPFMPETFVSKIEGFLPQSKNKDE